MVRTGIKSSNESGLLPGTKSMHHRSFERFLNANIPRLQFACRVWRDEQDKDVCMRVLHPSPKGFTLVNTPAVDQPHHLLVGGQAKLLDLVQPPWCNYFVHESFHAF
jgi:hypothetical protein